MPPFDDPLPLTPLVWRALSFAQTYATKLGIHPDQLHALRHILDITPAPHICGRESDIVDRYDSAGCYLYVRPLLVVLVVGEKLLYAAGTRRRISIRVRVPAEAMHPSATRLLVEGAL